MNLAGPRRINELRRIAIPRSLGERRGIVPDALVAVTALRHDRTVLMVRPVRDVDPDRYGRNDPRRPRRVAATRQLALPAALLDGAGFGIDDWVAFGLARGGVHIFSASRLSGPTTGVL
ncbi:hypothetical protein [Mycobacteroides abscessus]|uniref:hypothetical protein n=1 Tax=Mycobacteroides abscessus TaxID=36809 RepID=UPI000940997B|nr:hypothetical protein [Mycobacteroides abscessus]